jgi:3-deoxy-7-phosphoheptulonate synthase
MSPLPTPEELRNELPALPQDALRVLQSRQTVRDILSGNDRRLLVIIGPCAIHRIDATLEYASRLKQLAQELSDQLYIVMRAYVEKARSGSDWKGFLYSQDGETPSIQNGLIASRRLFLELVRNEVPLAMEFVNPLTADYLSDLVTWGCIGARTVQSSIHRELASRLPMPVGMKNATDGSIESAIRGIATARRSQACLSIGADGRVCTLTSCGNQDTHLVLRGGHLGSNFQLPWVQKATDLLRRAGLSTTLVVDCSHGNSQRHYERQRDIFLEVLEGSLRGSPVRGLMVESFLLDGKQKDLLAEAASDEQKRRIVYGASSVDGCLGWEASEALLRTAYTKCCQSNECVCC